MLMVECPGSVVVGSGALWCEVSWCLEGLKETLLYPVEIGVQRKSIPHKETRMLTHFNETVPRTLCSHGDLSQVWQRPNSILMRPVPVRLLCGHFQLLPSVVSSYSNEGIDSLVFVEKLPGFRRNPLCNLKPWCPFLSNLCMLS